MLVDDVRYTHYESGRLSDVTRGAPSPHLVGASPRLGEGVLSRQSPQQGDHAALAERRGSFHPSAPSSPEHVQRPTSKLDDTLSTKTHWRRRLPAAPHPYPQPETNRQNIPRPTRQLPIRIRHQRRLLNRDGQTADIVTSRHPQPSHGQPRRHIATVLGSPQTKNRLDLPPPGPKQIPTTLPRLLATAPSSTGRCRSRASTLLIALSLAPCLFA